MKTYSELVKLQTFEDRFRYLKLGGSVGEETFGVKRWLNQVFYKTDDWKIFRRDIIVRDEGCDLGIKDRSYNYGLLVHHIEPITVEDIVSRNVDKLLNPENAITTIDKTHRAIHYGDESILHLGIVERKPNDTIPWR